MISLLLTFTLHRAVLVQGPAVLSRPPVCLACPAGGALLPPSVVDDRADNPPDTDENGDGGSDVDR